MKQWSVFLFVFGLIVIAIAAVTFSKKLMISTPIGYMAGFLLAMLFNTDAVDQGGARTNNAWQIWVISFLVVILIGVVWEMVSRRMRKAAT